MAQDDSPKHIGVVAPRGFEASGVRCGLKTKGLDLALVTSSTPAHAAGVFTKNRFCAAPILICRKHLRHPHARAIVVNAGAANACTGEQGLADARQMASLVASELNYRTEEVLVASTGVIGKLLDMKKIAAGIKAAAASLSQEGGHDAAHAIMTTDLVPKTAVRTIQIKGSPVTLGGMTKGSGMIHPNLATMLGFITTDAAISRECLRNALLKACDASFNLITVDGDTSTNDTVIVLANGKAKNREIKQLESADYRAFESALTDLCLDLAKQIARDGEGATRLVRIEVEGARSIQDARKVAKSIAGSNLVKTAIFGSDPNWGRILCAAGYSSVRIQPEKVRLWIGEEQIVSEGRPLPDYHAENARTALRQPEVQIRVDLGMGTACATAYTCDLTYDYIRINAEYHT